MGKPPTTKSEDVGVRQSTINSFFPEAKSGTNKGKPPVGRSRKTVAAINTTDSVSVRRVRDKSPICLKAMAAGVKKKARPSASKTKATTAPPASKTARASSTKGIGNAHTISYPSSISHFDEIYSVGDAVYLIATEDVQALPAGCEGDCCIMCGSDERLESIVECSRCLGGFHTDCLVPKLKKIPEGDWLCPGCTQGKPARNREMRTSCEKYLFQDDVLSLVLITGFIKNRKGDGETEISCVYFTRPEDTYLGRQKHHSTREVFLLAEADHYESVDSIFGPATVCQPQDFDDTEGCDVFVCEYEYDVVWKRFRRREVRSKGVKANPRAKGKGNDSDDDCEWAASSDDEDDEDNITKDKNFKPIYAFKGFGTLKGGGMLKMNKAAGTRKAANRYHSVQEEEDGPLLKSQGAVSVPVRAPAGPGVLARRALALSSVPSTLPCRDTEKAHIGNFVQQAIGPDSAGSPGVLYICGVPGTGKTACVMEVLNKQYNEGSASFKNVQLVTLNALSLPSPQHVYSKVWEKLTGQRCGPARALAALEAMFSPAAATSTSYAPQRQMTTLLLVDEIDVLITKDQAVLYNLFEWPTRPGSRLAVMGISNTHDLDSRVLPRIASRLSNSKLAFNPYSMAQLKSIVGGRLTGMDIIADAAIDLAVRKVASSTGDVRRVLELLRRSLDMAENDLRKLGKTATAANSKGLVTNKYVLKATVETYASIHMQFLRSCSRLEKLIMVALMLEMRATKKQETTAQALHHRLHTHLGLIMPEAKCPAGTVVALLAGLGSKRLLLTDPGWRHIKMKVSFNVTVDDVVVALKEDPGLASVHSQLGA